MTAVLAKTKKAIRGKTMDGKLKPKINNAFKAFLPSLAGEEYERLEQNIKDEGVREPLVIWRQTDQILDGMHRYEIATKHDIPYKTTFLDFKDEEEALDWIADNQCGRRNLTDQQRLYFLGRNYRKSVGARGGVQSEERENVAEVLAEKEDVSASTVLNAGRYAEAVDRISQFSPKAREAILTGAAEATISDVVNLSKQPDNIVKAAATKLGDGKAFDEISIPAPRKKNGAPVYDDRKIGEVIAKLTRAFTARAKALGKSKEWEACDKAIEVLDASWKRWQKSSS